MRKVYFLLFIFFAGLNASGQLLTEDFSYTAGQLITANGWTAHSGGGTNAITVTSPGLSYAGHPGSGVGNAISMTTSGEDDNKTFTAVTSGTAYASFLVNVSAAQTGGDYFIGLLTGATTFPLRIYAKSTAGGFFFGLSKANGAITYESTVRTFGTTYFVVTNYIYNPSTQDDVVNLWINPALGGSEPAATIPNITGAVADAATITAFFVRQGAAGSAPTQQVDAILVGTTWASVTPLAGGSTATLANIAPQPSGSITQGTNDAVLSGFSITPTASIDFTSVTVSTTAGTATGTDIISVRVYRDNNANGLIDGGDASVSGGGVAYAASIPLTITGETGFSTVRNYLIVANVAGVGVSTPGNTAVASIGSGAFTTTATTNSGSATGNLRIIAAPPGATTITAGAGAEPATISSLINTQGAAVLNFDFTITDDGATPATDAIASQLSQIVLNAGTGNTVTNWITAIQGVELSDGTNSTTTATIAASSITFTGISNNIGELGYVADNASKTYTLKIWLKTNLGGLRNVIDGQNFVFRVQTADVSVGGSQLATGQDVNSGSTNNTVDVTATVLAFVTQPANTAVNAAMANVTVSANDANGNRDLGSTVSVAITSTGTLTGSPVTVAAVSGLATFVGLTHTVSGTGLTLNAERSGTLDWDVTSNTFNISVPPIAAWDFTGANAVVTFAATAFDANLISTSGANNITRGAGAAASAGANSFRTVGFQNDGIATTNTDYFQVTLTSQPGFDLSLSSIDGFVNGTAGFAAAPGVSNQFAYSLDGVNFTLIGSPIVTGTPLPATLTTVDLTGISALQNVSAGTTVTFRFYASGQTTTGGWGFFSSAAGVNGLAFGGTINASSSSNLTVSAGSLSFGSQAVGGSTTSQSIDLSGVNLTGFPANITVNAPSTDFQVSNDNSSWGASTTIAYTSATLTATPVYMRFTPQTAGPKSGNVTFSGGGDATPPTVAVSGSGTVAYFSKAAGNLTDVATWGTNNDGTGTAPSNFTTAGQVFNIVNRPASTTLDADWTVSGAGSKIVLGDGSGPGAIDLTIPPTLSITGLIDINSWSELTIENTTVNHTYGTLAANSTIEYAQAGSFTIPNSFTYQNLKLTNGTKTLSGNTTTIDGNLQLSNITLGAPGATPFATIDLNGSLNYNNVVNPPDASSFTLIANGGTVQQFTGGAGDVLRVFRLSLTSNTTVQLGFNLFAGNVSGGGIEIGNGSVISVGSTTISTFAGPARINGNAGSTGLFQLTNSTIFNLNSSNTLNSTLYFSSGTIGSLNSNFTNTGLLVIGSSVDIQSVTITAGKIQIAEGATLFVNTSNPLVAFAGTYDNTKYFVTSANATTGAKGILKVNNVPTTGLTLHVGSPTSYLPVTLIPTALNDFNVTAFQGITSNGQPNGTAFTAGQKASVVDAVWIVNRDNGTGNVTMTTEWPAALEGATFGTYANNQIGIAHNDGTNWETIVGTGDNTLNTATRTAVNTFSPFGVGGLVGTILPVNFTNVKATQQSNNIKVEWSNMTELEVVNYSIERSADGRNFVSVGSENARLNNGGKADYSFVDVSPFAGINYYRIRSLENSGKAKYSIVVRVDIRGGATVLTLYPNPVTDGQLSYQANNLAKGQYAIKVFNNMGQQVYSKTLNHQGGSVSEAIILPVLRGGVYSLQLRSADNTLIKTFVIQ